jgi:hypothetical protein
MRFSQAELKVTFSFVRSVRMERDDTQRTAIFTKFTFEQFTKISTLAGTGQR